MIRPVWVEVDLDAIRHNVGEVRRLVGQRTKIMAVVKADGYGHGAIPVARAALDAGAEWLGVSLPEEGIALRRAGIAAPILVLGPLQPEQVEPVLDHDLTPTVCHRASAEALAAAAGARGRKVSVHVKVDTGMGRIGLAPAEVLSFAAWLRTLPGVELGGVFSHLARADERDKTHAETQLRIFEEVCAALRAAGIESGLRHLANSAAIIDLPRAHLDMVRAGIMIYGLRPSAEVDLARVALRPALSLHARVVFVKRVPAGTGISYGHAYHTKAPATIATLPIGYADGWTRLLSGKAEVIIGGRRYPMVGRICMDQAMVDLGDDETYVGAEAVLIGRQGAEEITADDVAARLGTINYEIVCMISDRVPRIYHGSGAADFSADGGACAGLRPHSRE
ncbi:MAG: alanine racemase [Firmicutes bacterium]|nr:alanine racemase [Bacillota bacterium]